MQVYLSAFLHSCLVPTRTMVSKPIFCESSLFDALSGPTLRLRYTHRLLYRPTYSRTCAVTYLLKVMKTVELKRLMNNIGETLDRQPLELSSQRPTANLLLLACL
jgi:hypothetical protein